MRRARFLPGVGSIGSDNQARLAYDPDTERRERQGEQGHALGARHLAERQRTSQRVRQSDEGDGRRNDDQGDQPRTPYELVAEAGVVVLLEPA